MSEKPAEPDWKQIVVRLWDRITAWETDPGCNAGDRCADDCHDILSEYEAAWSNWSEWELRVADRQKRFAEHLRTLREGNQEEQTRTWEHLEEVLAEDGKL